MQKHKEESENVPTMGRGMRKHTEKHMQNADAWSEEHKKQTQTQGKHQKTSQTNTVTPLKYMQNVYVLS